MLVIGYSYGSLIGAAAASEIPSSIGYVALGPPLSYAWALYIFNSGSILKKAAESVGKPKLLVVGDADQFCSVKAFEKFCSTLPDPKSTLVASGVDHFSLHTIIPKVLVEWVTAAFGVGDLEAFARGV